MNMTDLSEKQKEEARQSGIRVAHFVKGLCEEGERAAVILGASRVDVALEDTIKAVLRPNPGGSDDLFEGDKPLSTFSAKITIAYRLSLIGNDCERALQLVRRIRNDFAHAHERLTLDQGASANRVLELKRLCEEHSTYLLVEQHLKESSSIKPQLKLFAQSVATLLARLETIRMLATPYKPSTEGTLKSV
jgi:hypothetical protein